jgi:hypothetical protein
MTPFEPTPKLGSGLAPIAHLVLAGSKRALSRSWISTNWGCVSAAPHRRIQSGLLPCTHEDGNGIAATDTSLKDGHLGSTRATASDYADFAQCETDAASAAGHSRVPSCQHRSVACDCADLSKEKFQPSQIRGLCSPRRNGSFGKAAPSRQCRSSGSGTCGGGRGKAASECVFAKEGAGAQRPLRRQARPPSTPRRARDCLIMSRLRYLR